LRIKNSIELVSIHIPKTAGTAFRSALIENVGEKNFAKLDIYSSGNIKVNNELFDKNRLSRKITTIHGHFTYLDLNRDFDIDNSAEFITWLRNPVLRVLSNYSFLNKVIEERLNEKPDENLLIRMGKSLEEFVNMEDNQNVMSKFLEDAPLEKFRFIGIQDDYENELKRLGKIMSWKNVSNYFHNVTGRKIDNISKEVIELIKTKNGRDMELFASVSSLRN